MISLERITKSFNLNTGESLTVLRDLNLSLHPGTLNVLIGNNGSGKSTLFNLLSGALMPDSGTMMLHGKDLKLYTELGRSRFIARIFQQPAYAAAGELSLLENLRLGYLRDRRKLLKWGLDGHFINLAMERMASLDMGLENRLHQPFGSLSGGQQQAVSLIMATMAGVELLLMDEPTAALDVKAAQVLMRLTGKITAELGIITLVITHELANAIQFGDRLLLLKNGKIEKDIQGSDKSALTPVTLYQWLQH